MEGVGARLGRSSTRYGPATVFNGPVRKWKKRWVHVTPSSNFNSNNNNTHHPQNHHHHHHIAANGTTPPNGNNGSHLLLYKWTPLTQNKDNNNGTAAANSNGNGDKKDDPSTAASPAPTPPEEPPRRKPKYIPSIDGYKSRMPRKERFLPFSAVIALEEKPVILEVYLLEQQKKEAMDTEVAEKVDEAKLSDTDQTAGDLGAKSDGFDEKPDINDTPMEENQSQDDNQVVRQDLNESTLDLSLGLKSHDGDSDSKPDQSRD